MLTRLNKAELFVNVTNAVTNTPNQPLNNYAYTYEHSSNIHQSAVVKTENILREEQYGRCET